MPMDLIKPVQSVNYKSHIKTDANNEAGTSK